MLLNQNQRISYNRVPNHFLGFRDATQAIVDCSALADVDSLIAVQVLLSARHREGRFSMQLQNSIIATFADARG